jgi:hypothetical protein
MHAHKYNQAPGVSHIVHRKRPESWRPWRAFILTITGIVEL